MIVEVSEGDMFGVEDRERVLEHSSRIFYHVAIAAMILCYIASIVFSFDIIGYFGLFFLACLFGSIWIVLGVLGAVTFLLASEGFRSFLLDFGKFIIGLFNVDNLDKITSTVMSLGRYYPIIAVIPPIAIALTFTLRAINKTLRKSKREILTLSIMGVVYIASLILSIVLLSRFEGGAA